MFFLFACLRAILSLMKWIVMTTGTLIMIVCAVLLGLFEIFFKNELDEMDTIDNDPAFKGADGLSGVLGHNTEDLDIDYKQ